MMFGVTLNQVASVLLATILVLIVVGIVHAVSRSGKTHDGEHAVHVLSLDLNENRFEDSKGSADVYIVCLANGYASNLEWLCLVQHWPRNDKRRVRFLLPSIVGMGKSRIPENFDFSVASHVKQLDLALESLLPATKTNVHLVGICTGGVLALELAAHWQPKTLSLISTPYFDSEESAWAAGKKYASWYREIWRLHLLYYAVVRQKWILAPLIRARERAIYPHLPNIYDCVMDGEACAFTPNIENIMAVHRPQRAARIVGASLTKTLVIRGETDTTLCNCSNQQALVADTNAESFVLRAKKGANHFIAWNFPGTILEKVAKFQINS